MAMSKDLRDGREFFDGDPVDLYEGRFTGPFIIEPESGAVMSNGDLVTFIVTARVDTPKFSYVRKTGDLKRSNAMKVISVMPMDSDRARYLYDTVGADVEGVNAGIIETPSAAVEDISIDEIVAQDSIFHNGIGD
jgi:hypothetical protein